MTASPITPLPVGKVEVTPPWYTILEMRINDPDGATFLTAKNPVELPAIVETATRLGLRILATADSSTTERLLDQKLSSVSEQLRQAAQTSLERVSAEFEVKWSKQVDEDLGKRLDEHRDALDKKFGALFDEGHGSSVPESIKRLLTDYEKRVGEEIAKNQESIRHELAEVIRGTGDPEHPMSKIQAEIVKLRDAVTQELEASRLAVQGIKAMEQRPKAGMDYQAEVFGVVAGLVKASDDEVEHFGRRLGATGGADGDIVLTVDPKLTRGAPLRVAIEVTREAHLTASKLKTMLAKANRDRGAARSIVAIRDASVLGGERLAMFEGLGVIAVYDPELPPEIAALPLQLAIRVARFTAILTVEQPRDERDDARIEAEIAKAKVALDAVGKILGDQSKIQDLADSTTTVARQLRLVVLSALNAIDAALGA